MRRSSPAARSSRFGATDNSPGDQKKRPGDPGRFFAAPRCCRLTRAGRRRGCRHRRHRGCSGHRRRRRRWRWRWRWRRRRRRRRRRRSSVATTTLYCGDAETHHTDRDDRRDNGDTGRCACSRGSRSALGCSAPSTGLRGCAARSGLRSDCARACRCTPGRPIRRFSRRRGLSLGLGDRVQRGELYDSRKRGNRCQADLLIHEWDAPLKMRGKFIGPPSGGSRNKL
jgi:hypothetical protein